MSRCARGRPALRSMRQPGPGRLASALCLAPWNLTARWLSLQIRNQAVMLTTSAKRQTELAGQLRAAQDAGSWSYRAIDRLHGEGLAGTDGFIAHCTCEAPPRRSRAGAAPRLEAGAPNDLMQSESNCVSNVPPIALPRFEVHRSAHINKGQQSVVSG